MAQRAQRPDAPWSAGKIAEALRLRFDLPEFALFLNVRNATGYRQQERYADALAMSLWPSRGLELHGFEFKSSRGDWMAEKRNPAKAEEIARYCDHWWLVVGRRDIVQNGELPPAWGLLAPVGDKLAIVREAPKLKGQELTRGFVAALLRRAAQQGLEPAALRSATNKAHAQGVELGRAQAKGEIASAGHRADHAETRAARAEKALADFEQASGIRVDAWNAGKVGEAVRIVLGGVNEEKRLRERIEMLQREALAIAGSAGRFLEGSDG